jgi:hypothetical protein
MKKRWLIISYFANIDAMAPSHHIDDKLPFLRQKGIDIHLLSSPCGGQNKNLKHTRIPSLAPSGIRYELRYFLRKRTKKKCSFKFWETIILLPVYPFYFLEKMLFRLDSTWSWFITASIAAIILSLKNRYEIIYSTGGPVSSHISAKTVSFFTRIPHIAEFQDPLVHQYSAPGKFERYFIKKVEKIILQTAAASVFLTEKAASNAGKRISGARTLCIYPGAVALNCPVKYERGEELTVAHYGSLGGSRNLDNFFRALLIIFSENHNLCYHFKLDLYGNNSRAVNSQIMQFPYSEILNIKGKIKRKKAVASMYLADLLLLIQNTDDVSFETIPSKVYEYLHTGRPILALVYRNPRT